MKLVRYILRFALSFIIALLIAITILWATGNSHLIKAVRSTYLVGESGPTIADYTKFDNHKVEKKVAQPWFLAKEYNSYKLNHEEDSIIKRCESVAFVIVQKDSILFEKYWKNYSRKSLSNSFSMAKSFTALCIGAAIKEGKIKSINQKVGDFLPEFQKGEKSKITIKHLLQMSSGIDFGESYDNPFGFMAKTYYGNDLYKLTVEKNVKHTPGTVWKYQGGNTLLLSFILEKSTGQTLSEYFSNKFWKKVGAEREALWTYSSKNDRERAFCCFYSNATDFARIGQLMLDSGKWNNAPLIDKDYYEQSISPVKIKSENGELINYYAFHWWLGKYKEVNFYYARGIQGQYIVSIPAWDVVFVRLGHLRDPEKDVALPKDLIEYLSIVEKIKF